MKSFRTTLEDYKADRITIAEAQEQCIEKANWYNMQALQQTPCSTTLAFLEQKLKEVTEVNTQIGFEDERELYNSMEMETHLRHVLSFIRKSSANANVR